MRKIQIVAITNLQMLGKRAMISNSSKNPSITNFSGVKTSKYYLPDMFSVYSKYLELK